jgi:hypothetical protein
VVIPLAAPGWAAPLIVFLLLVAVGAGIYLLVRKLFGKKRSTKSKKDKANFKGVDLLHGAKEIGLHTRSVSDIIHGGHRPLQDAPDLETLGGAMEQNELAQQGIDYEHKFLGRMQFKLDYTYNQGQVTTPCSFHGHPIAAERHNLPMHRAAGHKHEWQL